MDTKKNDTISRQAAIDVTDTIWSVTGDKNVAKVWDQLKDLPPAPIESYWIPFEKEKPKDGQKILVSTKFEKVFKSSYSAALLPPDDPFEIYEDAIIAWMPCPAPYKKERKLDE